MRYLSVCSGIEAATCAWRGLGWKPAAFAEIADFPSRVLAHHYPDVPNLGDFTKIGADDVGSIDLLVGGTPCQSFSDAGNRTGLDDPRGNLALKFFRLARRVRARWLVWENVRGALSSGGGRDFGIILGSLAELGYGWAYRVLDAQYAGIPQRRRRVFVVGHSGGAWQRAAAVLFERAGLSWDPPPRREEGSLVAGTLEASASERGWRVGPDEAAAHHLVAHALTTRDGERMDPNGETLVTAFHGNQDPISGPVSPALGRNADMMAVAVFDQAQITCPDNRSSVLVGAPRPTLSRLSRPAIAGSEVRRLTPLEKERLMGFEDNYTNIPGASDAARGEAIGNSMAVPCMRWIGRRIQMVEEIATA